MNVLLIIFNLQRGLILFIDPYFSNVNDLTIHHGVVFLFWGSTVPCFVSAFILMNMALLDITKMKLYSTKLRSMKLISSIIATNFLLVVSFDITVALKPKLRWLLYICQSLFLLLGVAVAVAMLYTGRRVLQKLKESARDVSSFDAEVATPGAIIYRCPVDNSANTRLPHLERRECDDGAECLELSTAFENGNTIHNCIPVSDTTRVIGTQTHRKSRALRKGTQRLTVITMVTSVAAIGYSLVNAFSLFAVYDSSKAIHPWHWFVYQTISRALEVTMSACISYIARAKDVVTWCQRLRALK